MAWIAAAGLGLFTVISAVAIGVYYYTSTAKTVQIAKDGTLCPVSGFNSITDVLLDISDPLPDTAQAQAEIYLQDQLQSISKYGLLEVRVLQSEAPYQKLIFSKCNPGDGSDLSAITASPELAQKIWAADFEKPAKEAIRRGLTPTVEKSSPIMGAMQRIAIERLSANKASNVPKRVIVVSDMIESNPYYSQFKDQLDYAYFRKSPAYLAFKTDMKGSLISILYVLRQTNRTIDRRAHIAFWQQWVHDNNAKWEKAISLQGINSTSQGQK